MRAEKTFKWIVDTAVKTLGIPTDEAERRVKGLLKSGILNHGGPDDPRSIELIDTFMQIPSGRHAEMMPEIDRMTKDIYGK